MGVDESHEDDDSYGQDTKSIEEHPNQKLTSALAVSHLSESEIFLLHGF
jgi:hypothetical protein